jgi:TfoX/Sxy family transcriptional regulator of competence genes
MPYNEPLAERIRCRLTRRKGVEEKKMFGSIVFLLNGNVCVGVWKNSLIVRVGSKQYPNALKESFVSEFDVTGRAMTGWVLVGPESIEDDDQLQEWVDRAVRFVKTLPAKSV